MDYIIPNFDHFTQFDHFYQHGICKKSVIPHELTEGGNGVGTGATSTRMGLRTISDPPAEENTASLESPSSSFQMPEF